MTVGCPGGMQPHRATRTPKAKRKTGAQKEGSDSLRARPGGPPTWLAENGQVLEGMQFGAPIKVLFCELDGATEHAV